MQLSRLFVYIFLKTFLIPFCESGGGFGGMAGGQGFQAFGGNQGASPGFGSAAPAAQTNLFTQMRK
jgi:hypothetical protein